MKVNVLYITTLNISFDGIVPVTGLVGTRGASDLGVFF